MQIPASLVKELRQRTGAGMMECKKALAENAGNIDAAIEALRKSGLAKADKKADRITAEGRIAAAQSAGKAVLVEINSETDFVAKDGQFIAFTETVAAAALACGTDDVQVLKNASVESGQSVEEARAAAIAKLGENIQIRRVLYVDGSNTVAAYVHGGRIGVLLELAGGDEELARGLAMHVAAMNPLYRSKAEMPAELLAKEREIALAALDEKDKAKPEAILERILAGKLDKGLVNEVTLYGQKYVLDSEKRSVEDVLKANGAQVVGYQRLVVGEGIEKVAEDYAAEVAKAMQV